MNDQMNNIIHTIKSNVDQPTIKNIKKEFESLLILTSWSVIKEEYENMNTKQKMELIKTIRKVIIDGLTPNDKDDSKEVETESTEEVTESTEETEVQRLIREETEELHAKQVVLRKELQTIKSRLNDINPNKRESKMDMCKTIFKTKTDLSRKEYLELFMNEAGCTKAGAATYYATIKQGIKVEPVKK